MAKYDVIWCDGNGAASRGFESDSYIKTHINAGNESEMWKLAYLLRVAHLIKSASNKNIQSIKDYLMDDWGYEEEEIQDMFEKNDYKEEDLDDINLDGIDGGDPWIVSIMLDGEQIYYDGATEIDVDEDEDW